MITEIVIGLLGLWWAIGFIIMIVEFKTAKLGYEDETGFHYGEDPLNSEREP